MEAGSAHLVLVFAQGTRRPRNKNPARRTALADWRSFGEYIFLEDSRYASQRENTPRRRIYPPCTLRCLSGLAEICCLD
jgi:hypothetical protein